MLKRPATLRKQELISGHSDLGTSESFCKRVDVPQDSMLPPSLLSSAQLVSGWLLVTKLCLLGDSISGVPILAGHVLHSILVYFVRMDGSICAVTNSADCGGHAVCI